MARPNTLGFFLLKVLLTIATIVLDLQAVKWDTSYINSNKELQMTLSTVKRAYRLFSHEHADKNTIRANVVKYLAARQYLGDKHVLATFVQRKPQQPSVLRSN